MEEPVTSIDLLLSCPVCKCLLHDAVQLKCLHNCCRQCFSAASSPGNSQSFRCVVCGEITLTGILSPPAPPPSQLFTPQQHSQQKESSPSASSCELQQQQQQQCFSFGDASLRVQLCGECAAVTLTQDGRSLLLAFVQHGLIELSSVTGRELSHWEPPKHSNSSDQGDEVYTVAALSDGRAVVALNNAPQLVVLQRQDERAMGRSNAGRAAAVTAAAAAAWTEDRRIQLQWSADFLSAHGDVLAMSGTWELDGNRLQLLRLSSERPFSDTELQREYRIRSVALTARLVITGSRRLVKLPPAFRRTCSGGFRLWAYVLDAHILDTENGSDVRLWRYVLGSSSRDSTEEEVDEVLQGVCADPGGSCLYAAVYSDDIDSGRVFALSLADGSELRRVVLSFPSAAAGTSQLYLPVALSLCDDGAAEEQEQSFMSGRSDSRSLMLAVLFLDPTTKMFNTVTVHRSIGDISQ